MQRVPRLTEGFIRRRRALGLTSGASATALARTVGALARGPLPGAADFETLVPPVRRYWVRRVSGFNLWVFYTFSDDNVTLRTLSNSPPVPLDDD